VEAAEEHDAFLVSDEVYQGAELNGQITPSFWGMSDRVIVTSGLSKAFGIPGVRIGWIVGPPMIVDQCWAQHDYISIGPGKLSDIVARVVVRPENRRKLFARAATLLNENEEVLRGWVDSFEGFLDYVTPKAGAFAFVKYHSDTPSVELAERVRNNQDVLVVPGLYFGMEGYLRIGIGVAREQLEEGLARIGGELRSVARGG
jgi:aspartate/methionine/tyrosine aminotransferase